MKISDDSNLDERQKLKRYKIIAEGFIIFVCLTFIAGLVKSEEYKVMDSMDMYFSICEVTICYIFVRLIMKDAFIGYKESGKKAIIIIFSIASLLILPTNLFKVINKVMNGNNIGYDIPYLIAGICFAIISIVFFIKNYKNKKEELEEE